MSNNSNKQRAVTYIEPILLIALENLASSNKKDLSGTIREILITHLSDQGLLPENLLLQMLKNDSSS